jgi:hypothetical protein
VIVESIEFQKVLNCDEIAVYVNNMLQQNILKSDQTNIKKVKMMKQKIIRTWFSLSRNMINKKSC